jgi:RNA polymerase sigma factor (sigma-70 family)
MTFVDKIKDIQAMACNITKLWGGRFSVDELVNEAWIRNLRYNFSDAPLIMRRAYMDMIDYIRQQVGRNKFISHGKCRTRVKPIPKHITGMEFVTNGRGKECHSTLFDIPYKDKNLLRLENNEILLKLLLSQPTTRQLQVMIAYFFEEKYLREIAKLLGRSECNLSKLIKKGIERCRSAPCLTGIQ